MSLHVPEFARVTDGPMGSDYTFGNNGAFDIESPSPGWHLALICSDGSDATVSDKWEHVSAHAYNRSGKMRTPSWDEMCYVKRLCWDAEDVVMQLHPRESEYVNNHPHVLHLWRPLHAAIPEPPSIFVGVK